MSEERDWVRLLVETLSGRVTFTKMGIIDTSRPIGSIRSVLLGGGHGGVNVVLTDQIIESNKGSFKVDIE